MYRAARKAGYVYIADSFTLCINKNEINEIYYTEICENASSTSLVPTSLQDSLMFHFHYVYITIESCEVSKNLSQSFLSAVLEFHFGVNIANNVPKGDLQIN